MTLSGKALNEKARSASSLWSNHSIVFALSVLLAPALWVTFVATFALHETVVGAAACAATLAFSVFVCRSSDTRLTLRARDVVQCWRVPGYILSKVAEITLLLFKDLLGIEKAQHLFRVCGFDAAKHDPLRTARMVMAVAYTTVAPNFIVVDIDASQSRMLFHQIASSSVPEMTKALGAKS